MKVSEDGGASAQAGGERCRLAGVELTVDDRGDDAGLDGSAEAAAVAEAIV